MIKWIKYRRTWTAGNDEWSYMDVPPQLAYDDLAELIPYTAEDLEKDLRAYVGLEWHVVSELPRAVVLHKIVETENKMKNLRAVFLDLLTRRDSLSG